jgi:hypothetical protein
MSTNYALAEPTNRGFSQLPGQKKKTGAGEGMAYGDLITYVRANDQWEKAIAASVRPFGFCGNTDILTQSQDMLTGTVTYTRGTTDSDTHVSVIVAGLVKRIASGAIPPGEYVMPDATSPLTKVMAWNSTSGGTIVGRYIRNITQADNNQLAASVANDEILVELVNDVPETGTGA